MTKAQARKRMLEANKKIVAVLMLAHDAEFKDFGSTADFKLLNQAAVNTKKLYFRLK